MATSPQQTELAASVNQNLKAEFGRRDATTAQIAEWAGITENTVRSRRSGKTDWTLAEVTRLTEAMGLVASVLIMSRSVEPGT